MMKLGDAAIYLSIGSVPIDNAARRWEGPVSAIDYQGSQQAPAERSCKWTQFNCISSLSILFVKERSFVAEIIVMEGRPWTIDVML